MPGESTENSPAKGGEKFYNITKPLQNMTDEEATEYIELNYKYARSNKLDDIARNERYENIYAALDPPDTRIDEGANKLEEDERLYANSYLPVVAALVDTAVANIWNGFFYGPEYISGEAGDPMDEIAISTKIVPHMMNTHRQSNFKHTIFRAALGCCCFDYATTIGFWHLRAGYIPKREELIEVMGLGRVNQPRRRVNTRMQWVPDKIDRFETQYIPYKMCFHDPDSIHGLDDSEYFFHYWWEPFGKMKDQERTDERPYGRYYNLDKVEKLVKAGSAKAISKTDSDSSSTNVIRRTRVKVIQCITEHHIIRSVGGIIISRQDSFGWPIQIWKYHEEEAKFKGIGLAQRAERPQLDINADTSDRRDYWNRALKPPTVVDGGLVGKEGGNIIISSGKVFIKPTEDQRDASKLIHSVPIGAPPPTSPMAEMALQIKTMEDVMGVNENDMGRYSAGRRSAREAGQVAQGSAVRFGAVVKKLEESCLEKIYQMNFLFNQLYMTRADRFKHHGEYGVYSMLVTPEDYRLTGSCKFMARGSTRLQDDAIHVQQFMTAMDRALLYPQFHNLPILFKAMWKKLDPREFNEYVVDPAEKAENIPPEIENQIMAMGRSVRVSPANDHENHFRVHSAYMMTPDYQLWPESMKRRMTQHAEEHKSAGMQMAVQAAGAGERSNALTESTGQAAISQGQRSTSIGVTP